MLSGQKILVTGGSSGIGYETALGLSKMGAELYLASRDLERTKAAAARLSAATGNPAAAFKVDLSSQGSVRHFAERYKEEVGQLDALVNNAGALFAGRKLSDDGVEMTWALNHLGPFLLTSELLPLLQQAKAGRVVTVASTAHIGSSLNFDDIEFESGRYKSFGAYAQSKLANIMFTYALARRLEGTSVTANCLHPGVVASGFFRSIPVIGGLLSLTARLFMISEAEGAQTSIHLAGSPDVAGVNGKYFDKSMPTASNDVSYDETAQERLWALSLKQTGLETF